MKQGLHEKISTTDLVRNLSYAIDKVRISGRSIYITKGSQTIAELSPPPKSGYPIHRLAELLKSLPKLDDDASNFAQELKSIRKSAGLPENPWE